MTQAGDASNTRRSFYIHIHIPEFVLTSRLMCNRLRDRVALLFVLKRVYQKVIPTLHADEKKRKFSTDSDSGSESDSDESESSVDGKRRNDDTKRSRSRSRSQSARRGGTKPKKPRVRKSGQFSRKQVKEFVCLVTALVSSPKPDKRVNSVRRAVEQVLAEHTWARDIVQINTAVSYWNKWSQAVSKADESGIEMDDTVFKWADFDITMPGKTKDLRANQ